MNTNKRLSILFIAAALIIISFLTSCGGIELAAPGGIEAVDADPDYPNRVEISWLPVDGADIYYVYRSSTENGTYSNAGFSVTSDDLENADGVTELRFSFRETFDEGDGGTYYYRVTAASNADISLESSMSSAVAASTYSGTWTAEAGRRHIGTLRRIQRQYGGLGDQCEEIRRRCRQRRRQSPDDLDQSRFTWNNERFSVGTLCSVYYRRRALHCV